MYEAYYGLSGKPFQLNPDPAFYYASRGHKRAFAYLQYGLFQSEGFIVITGEVGAGKTTLVRSLLEQLDSRKVVAAQLVSTQLDADDMLKAVALAFGLPVKTVEKAQLLLELETFFVSLAAKRKRALLIVDEAQNLTPRAVEELRMLSNFQLGDHALLQSFLVGQPELRETMRSPHMQQLRQRVLASYHLGPLDRDETQSYVEHRLVHVGWKSRPAFEKDTFDAIFNFTKGVPRRINTLCNRLMLSGYLGEKQAFSAADVQLVAEEIKEELGPDPGLSTVPAVQHPMPGVHAESGDGFPRVPDASEIDPDNLPLDGDNAAQLRQIVSSNVVAGLEQRLARVEKTLHATLNLLHRLTRPVDQAPPENGADSTRQP
jgi:putative secretion ATPase (PEP-CTERM system associated)